MEGVGVVYWGDGLKHLMETNAKDLIYIPAGVRHLPMNRCTADTAAVVSHTDRNKQESVVLMPELEALVTE
jgi:uncharacterized RmlC-like cupin family protein